MTIPLSTLIPAIETAIDATGNRLMTQSEGSKLAAIPSDAQSAAQVTSSITAALGQSAPTGLGALANYIKDQFAAGIPSNPAGGVTTSYDSGNHQLLIAVATPEVNARKASGADIAARTPVYRTGQDGSLNLLVLAADADGSGTMPCVGLVSIPVTASAGTIISRGLWTGDTSDLSAGPVYVSATTGALTNSIPATGLIQYVGEVLVVDATAGLIYVSPGELIAAEAPVDLSASADLAIANFGQRLWFNSGSAVTLTIRPNATIAYPANFYASLTRVGSGAATITGDTGVTVNGTSGGSVTIDTQYASGLLQRGASDVWYVSA